jgi:hypothetical protein
VRSEGSIKGHALQLNGCDALPAPTARDTDPVAERRVGGPTARKNTLRVRKVGFESQQHGKIGVAAIAAGLTRRRRANTRHYG